MQTKYTIHSAEDMIQLGKQLVQSGYKKFWLIGELGAGKTHFTKGVAVGLGIDPDSVHSPTYVYFHEYDDKLLHVDMYRMTHEMQITTIGLDEKLQDYEYRCVERPKKERLGWAWWADMVFLDFLILDAYTREAVIHTAI